jgi:hypothetical protein
MRGEVIYGRMRALCDNTVIYASGHLRRDGLNAEGAGARRRQSVIYGGNVIYAESKLPRIQSRPCLRGLAVGSRRHFLPSTPRTERLVAQIDQCGFYNFVMQAKLELTAS